MNIKQTLKTAAVALPMVLGGTSNAAAQTAAHTAQTAGRVVAADTLKAMDNAAVDARTFIMHQIDSIAHAKADSISRVKADSIDGKKVRFGVDAEYISARHLPQDGISLHAQARKGKDVYDATGVFAGKHNRATMFFDGSYTRRFPVSKNDSTLNLTGSVGGTATIVRTHEPVSDQYGIYSPRITGGIDYMKQFAKNNTAVLRLKAEAGPAVNIKSVAQTHADNKKVKASWYLNGEAEVGSSDSFKKHPQVSVLVGGGHHPTIGANIYGGFRYRF